MPESRVDFRYTVGDVTTAQRTRFIKSSQFKIILLFWLVTVIFLALHVLFPATFTFIQLANWPLVISISLVYAVTLLMLVFVIPFIDYLFNRFWQLPLSLYFSEKQLRLSVDMQTKKQAVKKSGAMTGKPVDKKAARDHKAGGERKTSGDGKAARKSSSLDLGWNEIHRVLIDRRTYIVVYGPQSRYFIVPRSAFKSPEQEQAFRSLVDGKINA